MSYDRGWAALNLQPTDRIPRTEYISHRGLILKLTGIDIDNPKPGEDSWFSTSKALDFDFTWNNLALPNTDRLTHMGTAQWSDNQVVVDNRHAGFTDVEEVLSFDPVAEIPVPTVEEMARRYQQEWTEGQHRYSHCVWPGGFYNTVFSWCILTFGWDLFLQAAALDMERFERVLDGFTELSMVSFEAQARTDMQSFICHDDIVWTSGPVFNPQWYRRYIFPRYRKLFKPLLDAGKKLLYCSDGNYTMFVDDLAELGVSGFIFEPVTDLEYIAGKYGQTHVMMGNVDCRALTFGTAEDVEREVRRCTSIGKSCPGYFIAVGNHIPYNIPLENVELYLELSEKYGQR